MAILYITVMAFVTYLIRVIPLTFFRKKIENPYDFSGDILCDQQRLKRISWCGCCRGTCFL